MRILSLVCSLVFLFVVVGCTKSPPNASSQPEDPKAALIAHGKMVYQNACTACHNSNPNLPGALGPEIAHSALELIEARVLRIEYPAGYKPKRLSHQMAAMPQLKDEIPALAAYLNSL